MSDIITPQNVLVYRVFYLLALVAYFALILSLSRKRHG